MDSTLELNRAVCLMKNHYLDLLADVFQSLIAEARMLKFVFRRVQEAKLYVSVNEKCHNIRTEKSKTIPNMPSILNVIDT